MGLGKGGGGQGANLYGTEPASFYVKNLFLNLNVTALLGMASAVILLVTRRGAERWFQLLFIAPMYLVLLEFTAMAHKEERFLTPIYPLMCLGAALSLDALFGFGHLGCIGFAR